MYSARTDRGGAPIENGILRQLPDEEFSLLKPRLELVPLHQRMRLQGPDEPIEHGYFINRGLGSILVTTDSRRLPSGNMASGKRSMPRRPPVRA